MPTGLADYGLAFFALAAVAWVLVSVLGRRKTDSSPGPGVAELSRIVSDNTQATARLTALIEAQGHLPRRVLERLDGLLSCRATKSAVFAGASFARGPVYFRGCQ